MKFARPLALILPVLLALAVLPARPAAAENGEIVSIDKKEFLARGLGRRGLDLLMEKDGKVYAVVSPAELAGLPVGRMIEILAEYGVESNLEHEDYLKGLQNLRKSW